MVTIRDVAQTADVSVATVSAVINKNKFVSKKLTDRVEQAIDELNYSPNKIAQGLAKKRSYVFAYLVPSISNPIFARTVEGIEEVVSRYDYTVTVVNTNFKLEKYRQDIDRLKKRVDGIALTASHDPAIADILQELKAEGVPVVVLHSPTDITGYERVLIDDDYCIKIALDHLLEQGHRRIGFVGVKQSVTCRRRWLNFKKYMEEHQLTPDTGASILVDKKSEMGQYNLEGAMRGFEKKVINSDIQLTAIIAASDSLAIGVLDILHKHGVQIPEEMSVVGFDDTLARYSWPALTAVSVPGHKMGRIAGRRLLEYTETEKRPGVATHYVRGELRVRDSTSLSG